MARTVSHWLPAGRLRRSDLRRCTRRALVLLLVTVSANPTSIWADPSASSFVWRTPGVATTDAASAGPVLASPTAAPATATSAAATSAAATLAGDSGKLRWRQAPVKQESDQAPPKRAIAKQDSRKAEQDARLAGKLSATGPEDFSQTNVNAPAEFERFAPAQPAKRFRREAPPANNIGETNHDASNHGATNDDETVIRLTVGAGPAAPTPEEAFGVRAAVAEEPVALGEGPVALGDGSMAVGDGPISNLATRTRTRSQVLGYGRETSVRFAPEQTDDAQPRQTGSRFPEGLRAQYIAQQPRGRVRNRQAPREPAPSGAAEAQPGAAQTQPGAAETQPGNLPSTDNYQSTDRFQLPEPAPGDAMTPSVEPPNAETPSGEMPKAEMPDPSLNAPNNSSPPSSPDDFSLPSPRTDPYGEPGPSDSTGAPPPPTAQEALEPSPCEGDKNGCVSALEKLQANTIDHIALDIRISGNEGRDFPCECTFGDQKFAWRDWSPTVYTFKANGQCHKPMYFEDVQLERYGHAWSPLLQPVMSGAHFYLNVLLLPYHMGVYPPNECIYTLGYYRPGSCAPYVIEPFPLSVRGALFEGSAIFTGAWVWGFFAHAP